jgi:non-ribosomal peptide synthetase-like protein
LQEWLPAALVPLLAVVDDLPTRTSGKVDRAALPWPLPTVGPGGAALSDTESWLAEGWAEILGVEVADPAADFFAHGGGSLTAAQLIARIRLRHPSVSVADIYQEPTLGGLAAHLDALDASTGNSQREVRPTPRPTGLLQLLIMLPMWSLVGLRRLTVLAVISNVLTWAGSVTFLPTVSWWWIITAWLVLFTPVGRITISAVGARFLLDGVRPGAYPRGGNVHLRLWTAQQLAEFSGATEVSGASWTAYYARALGANVADDVDLHSPPPITGMLKISKGAAVEPEVDLSGYWVDGDRVHIGKIRIGADSRIGARSTLLPGARIGKRAEIAAGSTVHGSVPAGQRWSGSPASRVNKSALAWPSSRPPRSRSWIMMYGVASMLLGLLPMTAAVPGAAMVAHAISGSPDLGSALMRTLPVMPVASVSYFIAYALLVLICVRSLSIGMHEGYHPVHGRVAWQVWVTERLMDMARVDLFPLYASLVTPVWLRLLGARVGRDVEVSTVLALPKMTSVADGAFLADDTMVATYDLGGGWLHVAPAWIGKQAFLGNSGITAAGRRVPKRGLVGVLSSTPRKAKKGSSWLGMPPMPLRRSVDKADRSRTFAPPLRLELARAFVELFRIVPVMLSVTLSVLVLAALAYLHTSVGLWGAMLLAGPVMLGAGLLACAVTTLVKWLLAGRYRAGERPLWCSFVWRTELADMFVEVLAVPWLIGAALGTPLLTMWQRSMGAKIGRGVWLETYWLPEADLVRLGAGATVNRGCVVQTHLFHDRVMRLDEVRLDAGATLGPHGIVLPGASIGSDTTIGPGSLVTRGDEVPARTSWLGNPIANWQKGRDR